jgi:hypothetical protein
MAKDNDIELTFEEQETDIQESALSEQPENGQQPLAMEKDKEEKLTLEEKAEIADQKLKDAIKRIKENVHEDDPRPTQSLTFRSILGGDILTGEVVRKHIWLFVFIVALSTAYVAVRYQCQQDLIAIDKLNAKLTEAKYKALSSSSTLTEKCRESHVLEILKQNKDSLLHIADQPPYIINVPE